MIGIRRDIWWRDLPSFRVAAIAVGSGFGASIDHDLLDAALAVTKPVHFARHRPFRVTKVDYLTDGAASRIGRW